MLRALIERRSFRQPFTSTVSADFTANIIRNVWAHAIIFCGHFPDQTYTFSREETDEETRGGRYVRQLLGAANIEGGPLFHVISGNLGFQVEHHLYPDMPSTRYGEISPRVRDICERYELPYNTGPFFQQWAMVHRTIARLALPGGKARPKPGPYHVERGSDGPPTGGPGRSARASDPGARRARATRPRPWPWWAQARRGHRPPRRASPATPGPAPCSGGPGAASVRRGAAASKR